MKETEKTFSTPQKAFEHYLEGVKVCDMQMMSEAYGIRKLVKDFNFAAQANSVKAIFPTQTLITNKYPQFITFNEIHQLDQCAFAYITILHSANNIDWSNTPVIGENDIENYEKTINPASLKI